MNKLLLIPGVLMLLFSCGGSQDMERLRKSVDSLSGALSASVLSCSEIDTSQLQSLAVRYAEYATFLNSSFNDTVTRHDADLIVRFTQYGQTAISGRGKLNALKERSKLVEQQLSILSGDIVANRITPAVKQDVVHEAAQVQLLVTTINAEKRAIQQSLDGLKSIFPEVENAIRRYNNGQLPFIVRDSTP